MHSQNLACRTVNLAWRVCNLSRQTNRRKVISRTSQAFADDQQEEGSSVWSTVAALDHELVLTGNSLSNLNFSRLNEEEDTLFYSSSRFVQHVDDGFRSRLTDLYTQEIPNDSAVLDLCSSWTSHLPTQQVLDFVQGHGLNEAELQANLQLNGYIVQDLNANPLLPLPDASFHTVLCCSGIQYLTQPVEVLKEVYRVLRPKGKAILSFSRHCFEEKAVACWMESDFPGRCRLVARYLLAAGFEDMQEVMWDPTALASAVGQVPDDPTPRALSDPFCSLIAHKPDNAYFSRAVQHESSTGSLQSLAATYLMEVDMRRKDDVDAETLQRWCRAYRQLAQEASSLGVPMSAIPTLPQRPTAKDVKAARDRLSGIIASFLSSGL